MNNQETKLHTISIMQEAIKVLTANNEKVTQKKVAEHCKLSIRTVMRYWKMTASVKKVTPDIKKVTAIIIDKMTPKQTPSTSSSFNRLKQRRVIGEQPKSILHTIPALQKLLDKL